MIDQNTNIKAKKNIMFSIAWFSKLRLNGTFIHLNKIANAHISYHDVQSLSEKKVEKVYKEKKIVHSRRNGKTISTLLSFFTIHFSVFPCDTCDHICTCQHTSHQFDVCQKQKALLLFTVKPAYNDHLGDEVSADAIDRWALLRRPMYNGQNC